MVLLLDAKIKLLATSVEAVCYFAKKCIPPSQKIQIEIFPAQNFFTLILQNLHKSRSHVVLFFAIFQRNYAFASGAKEEKSTGQEGAENGKTQSKKRHSRLAFKRKSGGERDDVKMRDNSQNIYNFSVS